MSKANGQTETERMGIDPEHELPQPDGNDERARELERVKAERDELYDRLARMQAEFENFRKRTQREQADFRAYAVFDTMKGLLPVLDSFERALASHPEQGDFRSGIELIYRQMLDALTRAGVTPIEAEGQQFDPRFHEAIEMVPTSDAEDNEIIGVLQRGYMLKDRLLRPAMVRVARRT